MLDLSYSELEALSFHTMPAWKLIDTGVNTGVHNMALDEELLGRAKSGETTPVLRLYGWSPPAVSLGRFQTIERTINLDACAELGIDIVRRVTGGRAVLHNRELTYSVVARTDNPLFPNDILGTYRTIALGLLAGFRKLGVRAEMVVHSARHAELVKKEIKQPACFSSPSWYEIIVNNRKVVGSAQRRVSDAFLQHGSILIDYDAALEASVIRGGCAGDLVTSINREAPHAVSLQDIKSAFVQGFSEALDITFLD